MREEWAQGLTRVGGAPDAPLRKSPQTKKQQSIQSLTMASRAMRLKSLSTREISERRQVGDAEALVNGPSTIGNPWWRNVTMEEGM